MRWYTAFAYSAGAAIGAGAGFLWPVLGGAMIWAGYGAWAWSAYILMPLLGAVIGGIAMALLVNLLVEAVKLIIRGVCALISYLWGVDYEPPSYESDPSSEYRGGILDIDWDGVGHSIYGACQYTWDETCYRCRQLTTYFNDSCHNLKERIHGRTYRYQTSEDREREEALLRNRP
jgi:hypothetical protein